MGKRSKIKYSKTATVFETSRKVQDKVIPAMTKDQVKEYEKSHDNMCRSLRILYERGLMSKKKYKSVCVNLTSTGGSVQTAKLVYDVKLKAFIKSVDMLTSMILQLSFAMA